MTFSRDLRRLGALVFSPLTLAPVLLSAALLAACGGGTEQVVSFRPSRLIVLGDENSLISDSVDADGKHDGFKYTINDRSTVTTGTTVGKCQLLPIFAQSIASYYGFVFAQCNPAKLTPQAFMQAQRGARVDDPVTGLAQQIAGKPDLGKSDLVSLLIGANDIIELYERTLTGLSHDAAITEIQRRGTVAAEQVNAILRTGARALVITVPDLGLSPYAVNAIKTDPGASALLSGLTYEFNAYLRTRIDPSAFDGRNYGLVLADDIVAAMAKVPTSFLTSPSVADAAACNIAAGQTGDAVDTAVLACDTTNLVTGATADSHLWASDRHIGPNAHNRIASQALSRAVNNPF